MHCGLFPEESRCFQNAALRTSFGPWVRWGLGAEVPSWLWGDSWGLRPEGIFQPTPACPRRGTRLEWISSSVDHQQSSRAQGARGSPDPIWPMETQWLGVEKGQRCFAEQRRIGAVVCSPTRVKVSRMQLPARSLERSLRYGLGAEVPSYLCGIHGAYAQKAFSCQVLLLHEGEHVWSGLQAHDTTTKAAGAREPEAAQTLFGLWRPEG